MSQPISGLSVGDKVKFGTYQVEASSSLPIIWKIIDKNHAGYPADSVTLLTDQSIDQRGFDAKEPANGNYYRQNWSNNRYRTSNLRQWLNSNGAASTWWTAQNLTDGASEANNHDVAPTDGNMTQPTGYNDIPGFMNNFSAPELSKMLDTTLIVVKNGVTDGGFSENITDKIFLLSITEVGLADENGIAEGTLFSIFAANADRIASVTAQCLANSLSSAKPASGAGWYWWVRSPRYTDEHHPDFVDNTGAKALTGANDGQIGLRPALNLTSDLSVSDSVDGDGAYTIVYNATPTISGADANLGDVSASFTQTFTVDDADVDNVLTITENLDETTIGTVSVAIRNQTYTIDLASQWETLALGTHSISVITDDGAGGTATRTYTFNKIGGVEFMLKNPIQTSEAARKIVVSAILTIPDGATFEITVCNNGLDVSPTWEDTTAEFIGRQAYTFINATKTNANWAVNVQFLILKGTAVTDIEVNGFGFCFE